MSNDASTIKEQLDQTRERIGSTVAGLGINPEVALQVKDSLQGRVDSVKGTLGDVFDTVKTAASETSDSVAQLQNIDVRAKTGRAVSIAAENPIGLALAGLAAGFLIGSLLPVSDLERQRLGPIRERVVDQAQAATHDLVEAGRAVVAETAQSVLETARSSAQTHGQEVVEAAKARIDGLE